MNIKFKTLLFITLAGSYFYAPISLADHGGCLHFTGVSYTIMPPQIELRANSVSCLSNRGVIHSGAIRLQLRAHLLDGEFSAGYTLGDALLGSLESGKDFNDVVRSVSYSAPPAGTYYMYMQLLQFTSTCPAADNYCHADSIRLGQQTFSTSGSGSGGSGSGESGSGGSGSGGSGGGGGCVYTPNAGVFDPVLPVLVLIALGYLLIRRRYD